jgi:DNA invertase Pin-like site-specific DNA recombinase
MTETHPQNRRLGYARVSTYGQTLDAQLEQLRGAGCTKIYHEKVTGAHSDRRELLRMLAALSPGDVVTVTRIDRLAAAPSTCSASSSASWTPRRNSALWPSRGPTPAPAPGA